MKNDSNEIKFVNTAFFTDLQKRAFLYLQSGYPVHFIGPAGVGKTSLALSIAQQLNKPVTVIRGHHELSSKDLLGYHYGLSKKIMVDNYIHSVYKKEQEIKPLWTNGQLIEAVKNGHTVIYDEFSRSHPETNNIFLGLLEEKVLPLYGKGKETFIKCHPNFSIIFTSNPDEYAGTFHTQDALLDRLITISLESCSEEAEIEILQQKAQVTSSEAQEIVRIVSRLRSEAKRFSPSLRASLMIASIAKKAKIPIHPSHKDYQELCLDVLTRSVKQLSPESSHADIKEIILKALLRKEEEQ
jgi:nitric oxide reductase NorQ protein